jgi:AcrR family transcriptional regulator
MTPRAPGRTERGGRPERAGRAERPGRTGRRGGDSGTREAILDAARKRFAGHGYDGATIRGIAADAGVDPALVHHFYGTKERLFAAAMRLPVIPGELISTALAAGAADSAGSLGEHLVQVALGAWEVAEIRDMFLGLLRSAATSERALIMLREFVTEAIVGRLSAAAQTEDPAQARYRAALVASQVVGLGLARQVLGLEPLAGATRDDLAAAIGPTLDRYLTGDLSAQASRGEPG